MKLADSFYLHGINLFPAFGPARIPKLLKPFNTFQGAFEASPQQMVSLGLESKIVNEFTKFRSKINLEREMEKLASEQIQLLHFKEQNYPKLLLEIEKFPPLLYFRGTMKEPEELCLAIVGTRKITNYGKIITPELTEPLADSGATIVSGMALGVDALAHYTAVKNGRRTIAVLGGGLDDLSLYPREHFKLAKQIIETGGALISEYPIGTPNFKSNFVARNRIISGLSVATIIIECDLKSGTLITAKYANEQNRSLYAVPGPIYSPQSFGPNNLLKMGAKPVTSALDVLEDLNLKTLPAQLKTQSEFKGTKEEFLLLKLISFEPVIINELIKKSGLPSSAVISALTFLEMKGRVKNLGGQQYILSR